MNQSAYDAAVLSTLHRGDVPPDHLAAVSDRLRPLAERLAGTPIPDRSQAFLDALAVFPEDEAVALAEAVMAHGVKPPPDPADIEEDDAPTGTASAWGPLRLAERPAVKDFPLDALPPPARALAEEAARTIGCPPDFTACASLAVASGTAGRSVSLMLKEGYFAHSSLFVALVGPVSDGKTPSVKFASSPPRAIGRKLSATFNQALESWKTSCLAPGPDGKKQRDRDLPPRPRPMQLDCDDSTMETLVEAVAANARGMVLIKDELSGLLASLNQYKGGKGADREVLLTIWAGATIVRARLTRNDGEPIRCDHPCLSIVGGMVPESLNAFIGPDRRPDGLIERFLFCRPAEVPIPEDWDERGLPPAVAQSWADVVDRLWSRRLNGDAPHVAFMARASKDAWRSLYRDHAREMNAPSFDPALRGSWGKFRDYAGRLALVLYLMEHASDPTVDPQAVPDVQERHIVNAWRLVDYFKSNARRVYAEIDPTGAGPFAPAVNAVVTWIKTGRLATFSERDVKQARRWIKPDDLAGALTHLVKANAIRLAGAGNTPSKGGRPATDAYDVNPALLAP